MLRRVLATGLTFAAGLLMAAGATLLLARSRVMSGVLLALAATADSKRVRG